MRSARLSLRPLSAADTTALLAYRSRPDVMPLRAVRADGHRDHRRAGGDGLGPDVAGRGRAEPDSRRRGHGHRRADGRCRVVLAQPRTSRRRGRIRPQPKFGGHGYATEAVRRLLGLAFDDFGLHRVIARVDARNDASARLARRLGMRQEAYLVRNEWFKGEWTDELDFALLEDEWAAMAATMDRPRTRRDGSEAETKRSARATTWSCRRLRRPGRGQAPAPTCSRHGR